MAADATNGPPSPVISALADAADADEVEGSELAPPVSLSEKLDENRMASAGMAPACCAADIFLHYNEERRKTTRLMSVLHVPVLPRHPTFLSERLTRSSRDLRLM